jgi:hypothetical protein
VQDVAYDRRGRTAVAVAAAALITVVAGCSVDPDPVDASPPPPPPAACLLDMAALAVTTGLTWTPDPATASDTRCVYDPSAGAAMEEGPAFVAVDIAPAQGADASTELDTVAALCEDGSRAPVDEGGFVCRFQGESVFAAAVRRGQVVTVTASAVPTGTTAARLVVAFDQQLATLAP